MGNIEKEVKSAIDEFGGNAYKRFRVFLSSCEEDGVNGVGTWYGFEDNDHFIMCPESFELKPLLDLFSHDVTVYGDNAYLMWEHSLHGKSAELVSNNDALSSFESSKITVTRKKSAALPFDIERAQAGDVIETSSGKKEVVKFIDVASISQKMVLINHPRHKRQITSFDSLRMKYPKKAQS